MGRVPGSTLKRPQAKNSIKKRIVTNVDNKHLRGKRKPNLDNYNIILYMLYRAGYTQTYLMQAFKVSNLRLKSMFEDPENHLTLIDMRNIALLLCISIEEVLIYAQADSDKVPALKYAERNNVIYKLKKLKSIGLLGKDQEQTIKSLVSNYINSCIDLDIITSDLLD